MGIKLFKKKKNLEGADTEENFQIAVNIVKNLDKTEFKKFMGALESVWSGYDMLLRVKTRDEKKPEEEKVLDAPFREDGKDV